MNARTYVFELALTPLLQAEIPSFKILSKFPAIRRDLAFLVSNTICADEIKHCLQSIKSDIVEHIWLFDVYSGAGVEIGKKSVAVAFYMQHKERTLTDDEVNTVMQTMITQLEQQLGAIIRT